MPSKPPAARDVSAELRATALSKLSRPYSLALRLRIAGVDPGLIAECVDVEFEAIEPLLELAEAKLSTLLAGGAEQPSPGVVDDQ